jgi:hypothetical protein
MTREPELVSVTGARVLARYILELTFDTGEVKVLDVELLLWGKVFERVRADYDYFRSVRADNESGTIVWPDGADLAPSVLYTRSKSAIPA